MLEALRVNIITLMSIETKKSDDDYHFVDTLAIIQDVAFKLEETPAPKLHWWNRFGIWLSKLWRK